MSGSHLCCTHPQQRIDSPEPPARPLASFDGIFAAAALPEDHPHALKFPDRKPELDQSIVKSPTITSKLKQQFRRKSMRSLKKDKEYDEDANRMSSREVLHSVEESPVKIPLDKDAVPGQRFGSVPDLGRAESLDADTAILDARVAKLRSCEYLKPLLQKPSTSGESTNMVDIANRVASLEQSNASSNENERPLQPLPKSFSSPLLLLDEPKLPIRLRRSQSVYGLGDTLDLPKLRSAGEDNVEFRGKHSTTVSAQSESTTEVDVPTSHVQEPTEVGDATVRETPSQNTENEMHQKIQPAFLEERCHLHQMEISHQLRSMSQMSSVAEEDIIAASPYPWKFHFRERSDFGADSGRDRHSRQKSSSGIDSATLPSAWDRVRSPIQDTASSIYSRPISAGANCVEPDIPEFDVPPFVPSNDLNALFADWPLKPSPSAEETQRTLKPVSERSAGSERRNKPLPPTPEGSRKESGTASFVTATNKDENTSIKWLSPPQRTCSIRTESSSSTLTKGSKQSKFLERFSPPKKLVRKRRSVFKFLRPGSRKQEGRSISTPVLGVKSPRRVGVYDGPSDDPALLTVQYELSEQPTCSVRSMSMNHLGRKQNADGGDELSAAPSLQRQPTLAQYERNLSVIGDDRRRPSAVNLQKVQDLDEADRRESIGIRRRLSRARALKDDASALMAQALEKHQQEKALFRSASKQRESLESAYPTPVFSTSPFAKGKAGTGHTTQDSSSGVVNAPQQGHVAGSSRQSSSVTHLKPPGLSTAGSSLRGSTAPSSRAVSIIIEDTEQPEPDLGPLKNKIGTSLDSWSRYPSHTRPARCGPAGRADSVVARDFAIDINPDEIQEADETEALSPQSKQLAKLAAKHGKTLSRSKSTTFGNIVRYYSNLFHTRGFSGQNRRTSITTAGRLKYPELEMLPPQLPTELSSQHHHTHGEKLGHFLEHMKEDAGKVKEYVREEEQKLEDYAKKEEDEFEVFMRKEEEKLEGYVKKEEVKFKDYVKEEEDELLHHRHHRSSEHGNDGGENGLREINVFGGNHDHRSDQKGRRDTMIGPNDDTNDGPSQIRGDGSTDGQLILDGSAGGQVGQKVATPSKAKVWSELYKECLAKKSSTALHKIFEKAADHPELDSKSNTMPPPTLKPVKPRSPEHQKQADPKATIRRFPSVTVVDDRKGHYRSVSFISVKTSRSAGFERSSTHDLLELIQAREREEREKLLKGTEC